MLRDHQKLTKGKTYLPTSEKVRKGESFIANCLHSAEKLISTKKLQLLLTKIHSKLPKGTEHVLGKDLVLCTFQAGGH